jgi:hypothetical protein
VRHRRVRAGLIHASAQTPVKRTQGGAAV